MIGLPLCGGPFKYAESDMTKLAIIGGGAAGMMASVFAARRGLEVHVYEKNKKLGKYGGAFCRCKEQP